jgi:hypothetical protein
MKVKEVLKYYKDVQGICSALKISRQAVERWITKGYVPEGRQWQLFVLTGGDLQVDKGLARGDKRAA